MGSLQFVEAVCIHCGTTLGHKLKRGYDRKCPLSYLNCRVALGFTGPGYRTARVILVAETFGQ